MIHRTIKNQVLKSLKNYPIVLITGARQVGKSTLCFELKKELGYNYISLENLRNRTQAQTDPELFLQEHQPLLIIDESQYAPILFEVIEAIVNKQKKKLVKTTECIC